jgi:hypothetical protein
MKTYICNVPAIVRYVIRAEDAIEAKAKLMDKAGWEIRGETIYEEEDLISAEMEERK